MPISFEFNSKIKRLLALQKGKIFNCSTNFNPKFLIKNVW